MAAIASNKRELKNDGSGEYYTWVMTYYKCSNPQCPVTFQISSKPFDEEIWHVVSQLADHVALLEEAVELAMSNHTVEGDLKATKAAIAEWKARVANYEGDLEDSSLRGSTRAGIRNLLNGAYEKVEELENHRAELAVFDIDVERERAEFEKILAWCKKAKQDREELTYTQKRDFLHMIGAVVFATRVGNKASAPLWDITVPLPAIQSIIYQGTMARGHSSLLLVQRA